jgi:hypothetical protein
MENNKITKKRKALSIQAKVEIINKIDSGHSNKERVINLFFFFIYFYQ